MTGWLRLARTMLRPSASAVVVLAALLGLVQADPRAWLPRTTVPVVAVLLAWFVCAACLNDLGDEAVNRVNLAGDLRRPLVVGGATRRQLAQMAAVAAAVAVVGGFALGVRAGALVLVALVLSLAYSAPPLRLSARGGLAVAVLPLGYVCIPYAVATLSLRPSFGRESGAVVIGLGVAFAGRILLKDFRDVIGDARHGKRTFALRHGRRATCATGAALWLAGSSYLLVVAPWPSLLVACAAVHVALGIAGFCLVDRARCPDDQAAGCAVVAQAGRALIVTLTAHFTAVGRGWATLPAALLLVVLTVGLVGLQLPELRWRTWPARRLQRA